MLGHTRDGYASMTHFGWSEALARDEFAPTSVELGQMGAAVGHVRRTSSEVGERLARAKREKEEEDLRKLASEL